MKKINSIDYGGKVIAIGMILLIPVPLLLYGIEKMIKMEKIKYIFYGSIAIGTIVEVVFFIVLMIELKQDRRIDKYYQNHKNVKLKINDNSYECSCCGNRKIKISDMECNICGIKFY